MEQQGKKGKQNAQLEEQEVLKKIEESAAAWPVPEELLPENIEQKLARRQEETAGAVESTAKPDTGETGAVVSTAAEAGTAQSTSGEAGAERTTAAKPDTGETGAVDTTAVEAGTAKSLSGEAGAEGTTAAKSDTGEPEAVVSTAGKRRKFSGGRPHSGYFKRYVAAAVAAVFVGVTGFSAWRIQSVEGTAGSRMSAAGQGASEAADGQGEMAQAAASGADAQDGTASGTDGAGTGETADAQGKAASGTGETADAAQEAPVTVLGDHIYEMAADYGSVYDVLKKTRERYASDKEQGWFSGFFRSNSGTASAETVVEDTTTDMAVAEAGAAYENAQAAQETFETAETAGETSAASDMAAPAETESDGAGYSTTNLQTEGVDESDIIKTDGDYIYQVHGNKVNIYDIRDNRLELARSVRLEENSAADSILEMYVQDDILSLITEKQDSTLESGEEQDVYSVNTKTETCVETYDISDRTRPEKIGVYKQDGYYYTSRKIGNIIYLFTTSSLELPAVESRTYYTEDNADIWLPCINGEAVAADDIYLPEYGSQAAVIGSFNCKSPELEIDSKMVINDYADIYVSQDAIYFYRTVYGNTESTEIAKFKMKNGKLSAVAATSVAGSVTDTFAVNEYGGYLRVLTSGSADGQQYNQVYVLDEKLELAGRIEGLAEGEEIYAARFLGNTGYFVTYRNTDPLFSVDFTDPQNPTVLGELKITGFSEYLHFWGEDKLLGLGYETDPVTGEREGVKLSMFDISDPANVTECAKLVLENVDEVPAFYQYKAVLADKEENLIGFAVECYGGEADNWTYRLKYLLFTYQDGKFVDLMTESLDDETVAGNVRGLFAQGRFFIADTSFVASYGREDYTLQEKVQ